MVPGTIMAAIAAAAAYSEAASLDATIVHAMDYRRALCLYTGGRDAEAEKGVSEWDRFLPPTADFAEQVIYHDLPADGNGFCTMWITNPAFGADVALSFRKAELPYLVQWRMPGRGDYVMGLEPANCYAEDYNSMAKKGLLRHIEPGQVVETSVRLSLAG